MSESTTLATTRQAAEILGVHESSIKRWNTSKQLSARQTSGGHRRFHVSELLDFARKNRIETPLLSFGKDAEPVWVGLAELRKRNNYSVLIRLVYEWVLKDESKQIVELIVYLLRDERAIEDIMDHLIAGVLYRIGNSYLNGILTIGDEHSATHVMRDVLIYLKEHLRELGFSRPARKKPVTIVGCGREEEHEIGALMVRLVLEMNGWRVVYLGLDVPTEEFAKQQIKHEAALVCISMMPPRGPRDVHHIYQLLNQVYNRKHPYRLAFGGGAVKAINDLDLRGKVIPEVRHFKSMKGFADWTRHIAD